MDRLEAMAVFASVVTHGSFSAASRALRMPLPTVSRKVSELESHIGAKLLIRSTRKLVLTEAGESYVAACKRILEEAAEADRAAGGQQRAPRGELVLTAPIVFGRLHVVPLVAQFLKAYPDVDVRLILADRALSFSDDQVDLALRIGTPSEKHLVAVRLGQIRNVVCASPAYLAERGTPRRPDQLASHQCITFVGLTNDDSWSFRDGENVTVRSRLMVNTAEAAVDAAITGLGFARVLSYQVADAVRAASLVRILKRHEPAPSSVSLLYRPEMRQTAKVRAFIDLATPALRTRLLAAQ